MKIHNYYTLSESLTPLRWSGVAIMLVAVIWAGLTPVPDILVGADGRTFAVRGADGRLAFHHSGGDTFATREWLAADADGRDVRDPSRGNGIACDPSGCIGKLADGRLVSHALAADALEEDCERAVLIVTARDTPPGCAATVVGRDLWRTRGALTLRRNGSGFVMEGARPPNYDRPWAPAPLPPRSAPASQASGAVPAPEVAQPPPRDATPPAEALDPNE